MSKPDSSGIAIDKSLDRFTFRQQCIDTHEASTKCSLLGITLSTPVIMSSMTMPIPSIAEDALMQLARALKSAGSIMWTGTPIPSILSEIAATGVPLAANVKPFKDRDKIYSALDEILGQGVTWVGIEIDAAQGQKSVIRRWGLSVPRFL